MIAVDWGSTHLRIYRLGADGTLHKRLRSGQGTLASRGHYGEVLRRELAGWDEGPVLLCGMIAARGGWHEMPYLDCPAGIDQIAAGMQRVRPEDFPERELWFVPGLRDARTQAVPDVMRGEETQLVGLLEAVPGGSQLACLPGTHSIWVDVHERRVMRIRTYMTGELYSLLRGHSVLGALMDRDDSRFDGEAFDAGLRRSGEPGGLAHQLFGVRTTGLGGQFRGEALSSYLSGLLVGHELHGALSTGAAPPAHVQLVGSERLLNVYARALAAFGVGVQRHAEDLAAHGLHALWRRRLAPAA